MQQYMCIMVQVQLVKIMSVLLTTLHALHVNLYLHKLFEPILFFDPPWTIYSPCSEREIWPNLKANFISETGKEIKSFHQLSREYINRFVQYMYTVY